MTNKDIIELVKELQEARDELIDGWECPHGFPLDACPNDGCLGKERLRIFRELSGLDVVAQDLPIIVKALERISASDPDQYVTDHEAWFDQSKTAKEALTKIRGL